MKWIIITSPEFLSGEATFISKLFSQGLDLLHLRKPEASLEAYKRLLLQIPKHWYSRIVLHEHFALAEKFGLHGIHLNRRCSQVPDSFRGSISCSCHTLEEVKKQKASKDYVFLSPIFDSILLLSGKTQITYKSLRNCLYIGNSAFFFEFQAP